MEKPPISGLSIVLEEESDDNENAISDADCNCNSDADCDGNWSGAPANQSAAPEDKASAAENKKRREEIMKMMVHQKARMDDTNWDPSLDAIDSYHPILHKSNCFDDGKRQIDYVMVYKPYGGKPDYEWTAAEVESMKTQKFGPARDVHCRLKFVSELIAEGLEVEYTTREDSWDEQLFFIKVHVPWERLLFFAEMNHIKMPFKRRKRPRQQGLQPWFRRKHAYSYHLFPRRGFFVEIPFLRSKLDQFIGSEDKDTFFRPDQRITICYSVLSNAIFDDSHDQGLDAMVERGILLASYPLHDGDWDRYTSGCCSSKRTAMEEQTAEVWEPSVQEKKSSTTVSWSKNGNKKREDNSNEANDADAAEKNRPSEGLCSGPLRIRLYEGWAGLNHICVRQPKDYIRYYFGDTVGLYYQWIGFWIEVMIPMAILGVLTSLAMIYFPVSHFAQESKQWCERSDLAMCPQCDKICRYWVPTDLGCMMAFVNIYVDNPIPVFVSGVVCVWAYCCKELWIRREKNILFEWNLHNQVHVEEILRADYRNRAVKWRANYVTGRMEPYYNKGERLCRYIQSFMVVLICVGAAIVLATCIIIFRVEFLRILWSYENLTVHRFARIIVSCAAAGLNVVQCITMSLIHSFASAFMTSREYHRTDTDYMNALGLKVFVFETFNIYLPMAYIAWVKGTYWQSFWRDRRYLHPSSDELKTPVVNWKVGDLAHGIAPLDFCDPSGCLVDLVITTSIYVCCTQYTAVLGEFATPRAFNCYYQILNGKTVEEGKKGSEGRKEEKDVVKRREMHQWERDYFLREKDLFWDYVNSVHAFGYTVLFVSTFPIAPLFGLIAHLVRLRMAAKRMLVDMRRPRPLRTAGVGIWINAIHSIALISLFTNAFSIAFSSNFCDKWVFNEQFHNRSSDAPLQEVSFQYFRLSRFAVIDFAKEVKPKYEPIHFGVDFAHKIAYWSIYNNSQNAVCYYVDYKLDPYVNNGDRSFHDDIFSHEAVKRENCWLDPEKCLKGQGPTYLRPLNLNRYRKKEAYWHVMEWKFKFAVFYVVFICLLSSFISFLVRIAKDDTTEGIMREAYEEQEMLYRNEQNLVRNQNLSRLHGAVSSTDNLNRFLAGEANRNRGETKNGVHFATHGAASLTENVPAGETLA